MIASATSTSAAPAQRRLQQPDHQQARGAEEQRPGAEGSDAAEGAGQARDPQRDRVHPVDAVTHLPPELGIEAERNGDDAENAHRHDPDGDDRHRQEIGEHAVGREPVKMIGRVRRGGEAGEQRSEDQARDLAHAPERGAGAERRIGAGARPRAGRARSRRPAPASPQTTSGSSGARPLPAQITGPAARRSSPCARSGSAGRA